MIKRWLMLATLFGTSVAPSMAGAQEVGVRSAERLEARANALTASLTGSDHRKRAELLREAAQLRPAADPKGIDDLMQAGDVYRAWGDLGEAYVVALQAFDRAIAAGEVYRAARAVLDAGELALLQSDVPRAERHIDRARLLMLTPALSGAQRQELQDAVDAARETVAERRRGEPPVTAPPAPRGSR